MKKLIATAAALILGASAFAIDLGIVGGLSFNSMTGTVKSGDSTSKTEYDNIIGGKIGAVIDIPAMKVLSIQPEVIFHFNNGGSSSASLNLFGLTAAGKTKYSFNSIEFPILVKGSLSIGKGKLSGLIGPTFNLLIGDITTTVTTTNNITNKTTTDSSSTSYEDADWNNFVVGAEIGLEYQFKAGSGSLAIGCSADLDFGDIAKNEKVTMTRFAVTPQVTYYFGL